jgi:hypothetical protein
MREYKGDREEDDREGCPMKQAVKKPANTGFPLNFAGDPFFNIFQGFE